MQMTFQIHAFTTFNLNTDQDALFSVSLIYGEFLERLWYLLELFSPTFDKNLKNGLWKWLFKQQFCLLF